MLNSINPSHVKLASVTAFAAPLGVLLLSRVLAIAPPALRAQTPEAATPPVAQPALKPGLTAAQTAARARSAEIASALMDTSPLYYAPDEAPVVEAPRETGPTPVAPAPKSAAPPEVTLSSIVRSADGQAIAFVNGRMTRIGDALADGWRVSGIDPKARSITIDHEQSEPVVITLVEKRR